MLPLILVVLVLAGSAVVLVYQGLALLWAIQMPRLDPEYVSSRTEWPHMSVIIAARNEELDLPDCLDRLLAQLYPNLEILVVDGGSTDRTRELVSRNYPTVRLLSEPPLPPGWVGKNWACEVGARATRGEYLLFVDADVLLDPSAIRSTVAWAEREHADLATLAPRVEMIGFWEKVVLPFYAQMVLTYFRTPRVNSDDSSAAMANGQYLLVRRSAYETVGGHGRVRGLVLEDVGLARAFRRGGFRLRVAWAPALLTTRMYRDRKEMSEGILKNVHGTSFSAARQSAFLAGLFGLFLLPLAVLPLGIVTGSLLLTADGALLYIALFGKHATFAHSFEASWTHGLLFPLAVGYYVVLVWVSLVRGVSGKPVVWKERSYPLRPQD